LPGLRRASGSRSICDCLNAVKIHVEFHSILCIMEVEEII
jgi:hypothetical protein